MYPLASQHWHHYMMFSRIQSLYKTYLVYIICKMSTDLVFDLVVPLNMCCHMNDLCGLNFGAGIHFLNPHELAA